MSKKLMSMKVLQKKYIEFWSKIINSEAEFEKKIHLQEIKKFAHKREKFGRAILSLKGKILQEFDDFLLIRFYRSKEIFSQIKSQEIVLLVDESFYKNLNLSLEDLFEKTLKYPIGTIDVIGKNFVDVWVYKPFDKKFLKKVDLQLFVNDIFFRRQLEALQVFEKWKNWDLKKLILALFFWEFEKKEKKINRFFDEFMSFFPEKLLEKKIEIKKEKNEFLFENIVSNLPNKQKIFFEGLNFYQKRLIENSILGKKNLVLHGPFGTGKTTTLVGVILLLNAIGKKILVTANSNVAVDNILEKLIKFLPESVVRVGPISRAWGDKLWDFNIYSLLEKTEKYSQIREIESEIKKIQELQKKYLKPIPSVRRGLSDNQILKLAGEKKPYRGLSRKQIISMANWIILSSKVSKLYEQKQQLKQNLLDNLLKHKKIILTTHAMVLSDVLKNEKFDIVIIDEGSQATEPAVLCSLIKADNFVIAGDHKQLPPTILSGNKSLQKSFFEKIVNNVQEFEKYFDLDFEMLKVQYRMNEKLMKFPNIKFYEGKLQADDSVKKISIKDLLKKDDYIKFKNFLLENKFMGDEKLVWFDVNGEQNINPENKSLYNIVEIQFVKKILKFLKEIDFDFSNIGIISPYSAQVDKLRQMCQKNVEFKNIEINTIDGFQGREKEIIIVSRVRTSGAGFLLDKRRFNVAITRAKRLLIHVGSFENFKKFVCKDYNLE